MSLFDDIFRLRKEPEIVEPFDVGCVLSFDAIIIDPFSPRYDKIYTVIMKVIGVRQSHVDGQTYARIRTEKWYLGEMFHEKEVTLLHSDAYNVWKALSETKSPLHSFDFNEEVF